MECHDRFFMIAVDLSFTGEDPYFKAVGKLMYLNKECKKTFAAG